MQTKPLPVIEQARALSPSNFDVSALSTELSRGISGEVRFDRISRALYSTDASTYQIVPQGVVVPVCDADVLHVVQCCGRFRIPITARGGGTSQAGQSIGAGIIIDCSKHFNQILEINTAEGWARVRPGCVLADLNRALKPSGLHFAPDISTANRATIGGMVANNSSGTRSIIYGKTVDHVLELKVLLADGNVIEARPLDVSELEAKCAQADLEGEIYRCTRRLIDGHADEIEARYPKILRRVGGYNFPELRETPFNLAKLFVGSEGTLGIVLEAQLRLVALPRAKGVLVVQFSELLEALAATPSILEHRPSAVEVVDKHVLDATKLNPEASRLRDFLHGDPSAILIIEHSCDKSADVEPWLQNVEEDLRRRGFGYHFLRAVDPALQQRIWNLRKLALGLSMAEKGDAKAISFVEDTAVRPENLRDYIAEFLAIIARHETTAGVYAHASVGCLHVRPVIDLKTERGLEQFQSIADEVADLVLKYQGALSGEHGDGLVRSSFQQKMYGPALYEAFRELKRTFDPLGILNPGKIVDAPPLGANLRYGPAYVTPEVETVFDFSSDGGLSRAAELCAGVGECRKTQGGVMCPSYRATREEQHSTRGRANVLRLAVTGQCDLKDLSDPALLEVMDLCLECKACKSECPTNVDVARLKAEVMHQQFSVRGVPLRNRVLGNVAPLSRWGSRLAPVSNWLMRSRPARWLTDRLLGIDRRRVPPRFARRSLRRQLYLNDDSLAQVLLFPDTFTNYYEPALGIRLVELLKHANVGVTLGASGLSCCGRPMISTGLLTKAVTHAKRNVELLYPWAEAGKPITACEPSCLLTIQDDYPPLLRGESQRKAEVVAIACLPIEVLLNRHLDVSTTLRGPAQMLVQPHCHQRALTGTRPLLELLQHVPNSSVVDLDAGCCGMAGAFGYEKEHYEVSRLVGEQQLFPALREAGDDTAVIAPGFSCRIQIEHFAGRRSIHPVELLADLLLNE